MSESVNAVEAWLGSLPGHGLCQRPTAAGSTLNSRTWIPLSAVWAGPARDETSARQRYSSREPRSDLRSDFSLHVGDVAIPVVGSDWRRKSVLLALMARAVRAIRKARSRFDFGGSIRARALAMGGDWHDSAARCRTTPRNPSRFNRWP